MRQVTCKVVGAKLVFWVETLSEEIGSPFRNQRPVARSERAVMFGSREGCNHQDHVAGLLHWHLIVFTHFASSVELAVGERVNAEIVWGKGELPMLGLGIAHDRLKLRLDQFGIEKQKHRRRGIEHIDSGDGSVAEVLLGHEKRDTIGVFNE